VPAVILKAVAFQESRWVHSGPTIDNGYGLMHLVDNSYSRTLLEAAELTGLSVEDLKTDPIANIRGAAALIARCAKETVGEPQRLGDYWEALKRFTGLMPSVQEKQAREYYRIIRDGAKATNALGMEIDLSPTPVDLPRSTVAAPLSTESIEYPPAIWNPADPSNYTASRSHSIDRWINHWFGVGTYAGAISWFQNPSSDVSAHFVIRKVDGELTQMVRIAHTAWHAGNWNYNSRSIGIEHEATTTNPWPTSPTAPMLVNSADCCRYFCDLYGIPKTRSYIIGHNEVPGVSTSCPGPLPWDTYMALVNTPALPAITQHPSSQNVFPGETATFTVSAIGAPVLTYRWQKNTVDLNDGGHYSGVTMTTLTVSNADSNDAADYRCRVTNYSGQAISNTATLIVAIPGDLDDDDDIDLADFGVFQACLTGPGNPQMDFDCAGAKLEGGDEDVDALDLAKFLGCMSGAGIPGDPNCLN